MLRLLVVACLLVLTGCVGIPDNVEAVHGFELQRYLGKWYEIARLDHSFERNLISVTADYSLREEGGIRVVNRGFNTRSGKWEQAEGRGYILDQPDIGRLKVSFFGPFYSGYNIIALDKQHYRYAMVCGPNRSYLWILARQRTLDKQTMSRLLEQARDHGFAVEQLIFVPQSNKNRD
jgi:apolipoprotein D and lipocalin family protein